MGRGIGDRDQKRSGGRLPGLWGQYFKAPIVKAMERVARSKKKPKEVLRVPVRELKVA